MHNLESHVELFDAAYPKYADGPYAKIRRLVDSYAAINMAERLQADDFKAALKLIEPLIALKNYKTRIPFPRDVASAVACIAEIRATEVDTRDALAQHGGIMERLLSYEGFRLPTASAVMHFCHPNCFPIVDVNVEAACILLKTRYPDDFQTWIAPEIPAYQGNPNAVVDAYRTFINFIDRVRELQKAYGTPTSYRYIDKALMMLGGSRELADFQDLAT